MSGAWTHPQCEACWIDRNKVYDDDGRMVGVRQPVSIIERTLEQCCFCGKPTFSGIYIRQDPKSIPCTDCTDIIDAIGLIETMGAVPSHGGTPAEMLRDLADFLDSLDDASPNFTAPDGRTLDDILRGAAPNRRDMQADVRWLADQLEVHGR